MIDWTDFIECKRGLLIAPAGHGKTTAIAECLLQCPEESCQLILTHTHAGIASLRAKFMSKNIPTAKYQLETITGFAQRYVLGFLGVSALPDETDNSYFDEAVGKCHILLRSELVQTVIKTSYNGVFVDEYQDCTLDQHRMILELAKNLPLHLLGDPLQGIFSFETKPLVDFDRDLESFSRFNNLDYPWRWKNTNHALGQEILCIRECLGRHEAIELTDNPKSGLYIVPIGSDVRDNYKILSKQVRTHMSNSMLIICPSYKEQYKYGKTIPKGNLKDRISIKQAIDYQNEFIILDAIDSSDYYSSAKKIDKFIEQCSKGNRIKRVAHLYELLEDLHFNKTGLSDWISKKDNRIKDRKAKNAAIAKNLKEKFSAFESNPTLTGLDELLSFIFSLPNIKCYHRSFYTAIRRSIHIAATNGTTIFEAMKMFRSRIRHQGRRIEGKCIGTTLLTKGLEFDTVIIWNAHKFEDEKNFYVAISRACKNLIILTETDKLNFFPEEYEQPQAND